VSATLQSRARFRPVRLAAIALGGLLARGFLAVSLLTVGYVPTAAAQDFEAAFRAGDYERAQDEIERALEAAPGDTSLRYQRARVFALAGANETALAEFDALLAEYPDDADYLLGRAQMLSRLGQDATAAATAERALDLAPDYEDVWRLRLQLADRAGDEARAATIRAESAARFPDASWWQRPESPRVYTRWLSLGYGGERLSNDAPDWSQQNVRFDSQNAVADWFVEFARNERFDASDATLAAGASFQPLPAWRIGGFLADTADADFLPTGELAIEALRAWASAFGTELRYRRREYPTDTVSTYSFTGDKYIASFRLAYRIDYSELHGAGSSVGHSLSFNWYPNDRRSFGLTLGAGDEIEKIGLDELLRTAVSSATLTGRETLTPRFELNWWLGTHEQGDYYRRNYAGIGIRIGL
jgi:YaiO family outer membrane protein